MENKHIKMIDDVLNYLYENRKSSYGNAYNIGLHSIQQGLLEKKISLDIADIDSVLKKLFDEKYVDKMRDEVNDYFQITFDGIILKELGGYRNHDKSNREAEIHRNSMTKLTLWISIGTIIAASYYVIQLLTQFHVISCCHCK